MTQKKDDLETAREEANSFNSSVRESARNLALIDIARSLRSIDSKLKE